PACDGMLHPEAGKNFDLSVVHRNRDMNDELTAGIAQDLHQAFVKVKLLRGYIEARRLGLPGINLLLEGNGFHRLSDPTTLAPRFLDVYVSRWAARAERKPNRDQEANV